MLTDSLIFKMLGWFLQELHIISIACLSLSKLYSSVMLVGFSPPGFQLIITFLPAYSLRNCLDRNEM